MVCFNNDPEGPYHILRYPPECELTEEEEQTWEGFMEHLDAIKGELAAVLKEHGF